VSDASRRFVHDDPKKIRSKHRRRILSLLSDGEATVSILSSESGLRMPHVSAEISRMRAEGLASSDLPPGSRGARIRLTEDGWRALEDDEWSKVIELKAPSSNSDYCCVLSRDEGNLTLCFLSVPREPLVQIPNRIVTLIPETTMSTRNKGASWSWAVLSEATPRWFDREKMTILDTPPEFAGPGSIESYAEKPQIFGIIRAKLLNPSTSSIISPGEWFSQPNQIYAAPLDEATHHRGDWTLGSPHSKSPDVRPTQPVAATIKERLPLSVLLRSARTNSLVIADLSGLGIEGEEYPIGALRYWIKKAHPRLSESERRRRLNSLIDRISSSRRIKVPESTIRKFRKDWAGRKFSNDESGIRSIELRGLGKNATESIIRWSMDNDSTPLVIEIRHDLTSELISRIASKQNLRLVILDHLPDQFSSFAILEIDRIRTLPWLSYRTDRGERIPVRMVERGKITDYPLEPELTTISPWQILRVPSEDDEYKQEIARNSVSIISSAISQFPDGDEEWANQMEAMYPLASWIASPKTTRWQRWQRVSSRLDSEWIALLDLDYVPIEKVSELAHQAPKSVKEIFSRTITSKLRENPDNLLRSWPAIDPSQANSGASWLASHFIQNSAWMPEETHHDIIGWAVEAWLSEPPTKSLGALDGINWLYNSGNLEKEVFDRLIVRIRDNGNSLPEGHQLNTWSRLYDHALGKREAKVEDLLLFISHIPNSWWAPFSSEFLKMILNSTITDEFFSLNIPWCSTVLRPRGEASCSPGLSSIIYQGCDIEIFPLLQNYLRSTSSEVGDANSMNHLWDLLSALESIREGSNPSAGRSHKLSGWLAQPLEKWPNFTLEMIIEGDIGVSESLILRKSGFHEGLRNIDSSAQPLGS
tara:strand:+ start:179 stop:2806 length:2628 start_codon:yes stop_codon:yes gene_type:complete